MQKYQYKWISCPFAAVLPDLADNTSGQKRGLDYSKAIVITNIAAYIDPAPVTIRQKEYNVFKKREYFIQKQFSTYVASYKKEIYRRLKNPMLPESSLCCYSSLKYFHKEMGLNT